jgi:hypothetical protein
MPKSISGIIVPLVTFPIRRHSHFGIGYRLSSITIDDRHTHQIANCVIALGWPVIRIAETALELIGFFPADRTVNRLKGPLARAIAPGAMMVAWGIPDPGAAAPTAAIRPLAAIGAAFRDSGLAGVEARLQAGAQAPRGRLNSYTGQPRPQPGALNLVLKFTCYV